MDRDSDGRSGAAWAQGQVRLQTRGPVQAGALYVARVADRMLVESLRRGERCVVLGPPRSGKTSLRLRASRLLTEGPPGSVARPTLTAVHLEVPLLTAGSPGAFYFTLMSALATELGLPGTVATAAWQRLHAEPPAERLRRFVIEDILARRDDPVVLFLDDIDALTGLAARGLDVGELFMVLNAVADTQLVERDGVLIAETRDFGAEDAEPDAVLAGSRLTFCLLGATDPVSLLDGEADPVPDAQRLFLGDLRRDECDAFAPALVALTAAATEDDPAASVTTWLDEIFRWTCGHPYLTQHLCQQLVARAPRGPSVPAELVERLARLLFTPPPDSPLADPLTEEDVDPCVRAAALRLHASPFWGDLLHLYRRLLSGEAVPVDDGDPLHAELLLCGLCAIFEDERAETPRLRPRCPVLRLAFSDDWVRAQEVRALLDEAVADAESRAAASESGAGTSTSTTGQAVPPPIRGVPLKTAQAWARRHPEALRPADVQVLLASLEAARQEAENRHQASAAALQREAREKAEARSALQRSQREAEGALAGLKLRLRTVTGLSAVLAVLLVLSLVWAVRAQRQARTAALAVAAATSPAPPPPKPAPPAPRTESEPVAAPRKPAVRKQP